MSLGVAAGYYAATTGAWRGRYVVDGALGVVPVSVDTSVAVLDAQRVQHTTRASVFGVTIFQSSEVIAVNDDGRSFTMTIDVRGLFGSVVVSDGEVDDDGGGATYRIPWLGSVLVQRGQLTRGASRDDDVVTLSHQHRFLRGHVALHRLL